MAYVSSYYRERQTAPGALPTVPRSGAYGVQPVRDYSQTEVGGRGLAGVGSLNFFGSSPEAQRAGLTSRAYSRYANEAAQEQKLGGAGGAARGRFLRASGATEAERLGMNYDEQLRAQGLEAQALKLADQQALEQAEAALRAADLAERQLGAQQYQFGEQLGFSREELEERARQADLQDKLARWQTGQQLGFSREELEARIGQQEADRRLQELLGTGELGLKRTLGLGELGLQQDLGYGDLWLRTQQLAQQGDQFDTSAALDVLNRAISTYGSSERNALNDLSALFELLGIQFGGGG